jgi:hypothetical protein
MRESNLSYFSLLSHPFRMRGNIATLQGFTLRSNP